MKQEEITDHQFLNNICRMIEDRFSPRDGETSIEDSYMILLTSYVGADGRKKMENHYIGNMNLATELLGGVAEKDDSLQHMVATVNMMGYVTRLQNQLKKDSRGKNHKLHLEIRNFLNAMATELAALPGVDPEALNRMKATIKLMNDLYAPTNADKFIESANVLKQCDKDDITTACISLTGAQVDDPHALRSFGDQRVNMQACIFGEQRNLEAMLVAAYRNKPEFFTIVKQSIAYWEQNKDKLEKNTNVDKSDFDDFINSL